MNSASRRPEAMAGNSTSVQSIVSPHICVALYSFDIGGSELLALSLIGHLQRCGARVSCVSTRRGPGEIQSRLEDMGVDCLALGIEEHNRLIRPLIRRRLVRWLRGKGISAIHAHHFSVLSDVHDAASAAGIMRVVVTEHTATPVINDRAYRSLVARHAPRVQSCTAINEKVRDAIVEVSGLSPASIIVIRNGVDTHRFVPSETNPIDNTVIIGWLGRLHPDKDVLNGLRAFAIAARNSRNTLRLLIGGDGEEMAAARTFVATNSLDDSVEFCGIVSDAVSLYCRCHMFLISSRTEGTPLALLEAMSSGLPVVATDVGDIRAAVSPEAAAIAPPNDPDALAATLIAIADDEAKRRSMASAARQLALQKYSDRQMKQQYEKLLLGTETSL